MGLDESDLKIVAAMKGVFTRDFPMTEKDKHKNHVCSKEICPICEDIKSKPKKEYAFFGTILAGKPKPAEQKPTTGAKEGASPSIVGAGCKEPTCLAIGEAPSASSDSPAEATEEEEELKLLCDIASYSFENTPEKAVGLLRAHVKKEVDKVVQTQGGALLHTHFKGLIETRERQAVENAMGRLGCFTDDEIIAFIKNQGFHPDHNGPCDGKDDMPHLLSITNKFRKAFDARWPNAKRVKA